MNWNYKKGILLGILMVLITIVLPIGLWELLNWVLPVDMIPYLEENIDAVLIIENGIVLTIMVILFAISEKGTILQIVFQAIVYVLIIYLFFVGSAITSVFLPCNGFANIIIATPVISIALNYSLLAAFILIIFGLYLAKAIMDFFSQEQEEKE